MPYFPKRPGQPRTTFFHSQELGCCGLEATLIPVLSFEFLALPRLSEKVRPARVWVPWSQSEPPVVSVGPGQRGLEDVLLPSRFIPQLLKRAVRPASASSPTLTWRRPRGAGHREGTACRGSDPVLLPPPRPPCPDLCEEAT